MAEASFVWNEAALAELFTNPAGPVGRHLLARAEKVATTARQLAPYRANDEEHTHVRDGITVRMSPAGHGLEVDIVSTATDSKGRPVGLFVEVGTKNMRAQPYLRPALDASGGSNG